VVTDSDLIGHAGHSWQRADGTLDTATLEFASGLALQGHPTVVDGYPKPIGVDGRPADQVFRVVGDLGIAGSAPGRGKMPAPWPSKGTPRC